MAANITYTCSNDCGVRIQLAFSIPVFKPYTPSDFRKLPIRDTSLPYVLGYESSRFCLVCKKIVLIFDELNQEESSYQIATKKWSNQSIFMKLINRLRGLQEPIIPDTQPKNEKCINCGSCDNFLDESAPCHQCPNGILEIDNRLG